MLLLRATVALRAEVERHPLGGSGPKARSPGDWSGPKPDQLRRPAWALAMARKIPRRLHQKHGAYCYVVRHDDRVVWKRLATTHAEAIALWAKLEGTSTVVGEEVCRAIERYAREILPGLAEKTRDEYARALGRSRQRDDDRGVRHGP